MNKYTIFEDDFHVYKYYEQDEEINGAKCFESFYDAKAEVIKRTKQYLEILKKLKAKDL